MMRRDDSAVNARASTYLSEPVRLPVLWSWLAFLVALLAATASLVGLLVADPIYGKETVALSDAATAQDIVTLLVVVPLLAFLSLRARGGSLPAFLCLPGVLAFTTYNYLIFAFSIHFGPLFLVWVAALGLSIFALIGGLVTADREAIKRRFAGRASTGTAVFLILVSAIFAFLWLSEIVPDLIAGNSSSSANSAGRERPWARGEPTAAAPRFTLADLDGLDAPVRRHLSQAIALGAPIAQGGRLSMRGSIKLGRWLPFRARQVLNPHVGFIWAARVGWVITGFDRYLNGIGAMTWKLGGLLSVAHAEGADTSRSAAGRGGAEAIWFPTAMLPRHGVRWTTTDDTHVTAHQQVDGTRVDLNLTLDQNGGIQSLVFDRWGDPDQTGRWAWHPFGGVVTSQSTFDGLTIPSRGRLGWHYGTDRWSEGEFFRYQITDLRPVSAIGAARAT